jgi:hypothetical protein
MTPLRVVPAAASTADRQEKASHQATRSVPAKLNFRRETLYQIGKELPPLLVQHSKEVDDPRFALDIDWNAYFAMTAAGQLRFTTARFGDVLVGYIANIVRPHLRFKTTLHCFIEAYWLSPAYREGWGAVRMFRDNDAYLEEIGVKRIFVTVEERAQRDARALFKRLGYELTALAYAKVFP